MTHLSAIGKSEQRYHMSIEDVRKVLRVHCPQMADYLQDSEDNMDGWEGELDTFYAVFFDLALWLSSR